METLYFLGFCFFAAWLVYWMVKNDDYVEFSEEDDSGKFSVGQKQEEKDR